MTYKIEGPFPLTLTATDSGASLDVARFLTAVFLELFSDADGNPEGFGEEFAEMHALALSAQHQGGDSHARHEFDARMEEFLKRYAVEGQVELYAGGLRQLADAAEEILAPRPVPAQQDRRAS